MRVVQLGLLGEHITVGAGAVHKALAVLVEPIPHSGLLFPGLLLGEVFSPTQT